MHTSCVYNAYVCKQTLKYIIWLPVGTSTPLVTADLVLPLLHCTLKTEKANEKCCLVGS